MNLAAEGLTITTLEKRYLKKTRNRLYISLEDLEDDEWFWDEFELKRFRDLWRKNVSIIEIAEALNRTGTSVLLLSLDQIDKNLIAPRTDWKIR